MRATTITAFLALALVGPFASGQPPTFQAGIDLVRVDVSVTEHGRPVGGLTAANFRLTDNGQPVRIASVTAEQALPLRVVLALDTSASVHGTRLKALIRASRNLVGALRPTDRLAILTFSDEVRLLTGFGTSRAATLQGLESVQAKGMTVLNDALQAAIELVHVDDREPSAEPVVIVCSDGHDTVSWLRGSDVLEAARRADAVVEWVEPPGSATYGLVPNLDRVVDATGGRSWSAGSDDDLATLFTATLAEMRARYLVTFLPAMPLQPGWHDLKVTLQDAHGDVLARPGYYVEKNQP